MVRSYLVLSSLLALVACASAHTSFPVEPEAASRAAGELGADVTLVPLVADTIAEHGGSPRAKGGRTTLPGGNSWTYRVGRGDILEVVVWDHPDLTMPAGEGRRPEETGQHVQSDGTFFYPYVGQVQAAGLTPQAIREALTTSLATFITDPQVEVKVVAYNSQAVSVTGEIARPPKLSLTSLPLTLLEAVDAAGGLKEQADASSVTVRRDGRLYPTFPKWPAT